MYYVKDQCSKLVISPIVLSAESLTIALRNTVKQLIEGQDVEIAVGEIKFEQNPDDLLEIIPANLYTALLMNGIVVPYKEVEDKTEYTFPNGNIFTFTKKSAMIVVKFVEPLKYIIGRFTVNKDFN